LRWLDARNLRCRSLSHFLQKLGEPFSIDKVNGTLAALKSSGKAKDVRVQVDAEASGVRVQFILEPAVYFGIFEFPGAERFSYARLLQVANFQAQTPFNAADEEQDRQALKARCSKQYPSCHMTILYGLDNCSE